MTSLAAILLAGGRATRLGGEAKPLLDVGGKTLLQRAVDAAVAAGAAPIIVVGPESPVEGEVAWVREDPPFGGPVAGVVTALSALAGTPQWTLVLACDLPGAGEAVPRLLRDAKLLPADTEGVCLADESSRPQWLTGLYRTTGLRQGVRGLENDGQGASMRELLDGLAIAAMSAPSRETTDVDTWEDVHAARELWGGSKENHDE